MILYVYTFQNDHHISRVLVCLHTKVLIVIAYIPHTVPVVPMTHLFYNGSLYLLITLTKDLSIQILYQLE